jgi:hypothetical protein
MSLQVVLGLAGIVMGVRLTPASASGYVLVKQAIVYPQNSFPVAP